MTISDRNFSNEFIFQASRSSGPGGQNVNKVSSKVELRFNVADSQLLNEEEKSIIADKLANRINSMNELVLVSQKERSQIKNKDLVIEKFYAIVEKALTPAKKRFKTKPSRSSVEKRLESKKAQSAIKANRKGIDL